MPNAAEYAYRLLTEIREEIAHADRKASILFGAGGVVFSVVAAALLGDGWRPSRLDTRAEIVWWVGVGLVTAGLVCLGAAVYPRIHAGRWFFWSRISRRPRRHPREAAHYFGDLADCTTLQSAKRAIELGASEGFDRTVEQAWVLSKLVVTKYRLTKAALLLYGVGGVCVLVAHLGG